MNTDLDIVAAVGAVFATIFGYGKLNAKVEAQQRTLDKLDGLPAAVGRIEGRLEEIHDRIKSTAQRPPQ